MENSYRDILFANLEERIRSNSGYSLRCFARDLGLAPSSLSEILKGKKGLSQARAEKIVKALRLPDWKASYFMGLVAKSHARGKHNREAAEISLKKQFPIFRMQQLKEEVVKALTHPMDLAILECTYLKDFEPSEKWCAKRLGVEVKEVKLSVQRLKAVGLLEVAPEVGWKDASPFFSSTDGIPSESIRSFHQAVLDTIRGKLATEPVADRTMKSVVFSLSDDDLQQARRILDNAMSEILELSAKPAETKDHVLCFSSQLFFMAKGSL